MKIKIAACILLALSVTTYAQITLPPGGSQKAKVSQWLGLVEVSITYSSPSVYTADGKDRTGHIWGELVPYGLTDLGFGPSKAAPWRAGADENTVISFSHNVKINGQNLPAGNYGLHVIVEKDKPWTFIFSKNHSSWGSYFYNEKEDALRVQAQAVDAPFTGNLTYGFESRKLSSAVAFLQWENKKVPFTIEVDNIYDLYLANIRNELRGEPGFSSESWAAAAQFCVDHQINLEEALTWAEAAIGAAFVGEENFNTLQTKANVLTALGRGAEADAVMEKAIRHRTASVQQIHSYGRKLLAEGNPKKALGVFQLNQQLHPEEKFTPNVGLARAYTAIGDKKNAIKYWELALKNIPEGQKQFLPQYQEELNKVKQGK